MKNDTTVTEFTKNVLCYNKHSKQLKTALFWIRKYRRKSP